MARKLLKTSRKAGIDAGTQGATGKGTDSAAELIILLERKLCDVWKEQFLKFGGRINPG